MCCRCRCGTCTTTKADWVAFCRRWWAGSTSCSSTQSCKPFSCMSSRACIGVKFFEQLAIKVLCESKHAGDHAHLLVRRCSTLYERLGHAVASLKTLASKKASYGTYASPDELAESGSAASCAICQVCSTGAPLLAGAARCCTLSVNRLLMCEQRWKPQFAAFLIDVVCDGGRRQCARPHGCLARMCSARTASPSGLSARGLAPPAERCASLRGCPRMRTGAQASCR